LYVQSNLKTAKALGLTILPSLLLRATQALSMRGLRARAPGAVFLQASRLQPELREPPDDRARRASGGRGAAVVPVRQLVVTVPFRLDGYARRPRARPARRAQRGAQ
jgi:hypothetical protein